MTNFLIGLVVGAGIATIFAVAYVRDYVQWRG